MINNVLKYSKKLKSKFKYWGWYSAWEKTILIFEKNMKYLPGFPQDTEFQEVKKLLAIKRSCVACLKLNSITQNSSWKYEKILN